MTDIAIRDATADDFPAIATLLPRLADVVLPAWRTPDEVIRAEAAALQSAMEDPSPDGAIFVAQVDGAIAGFIYLVALSDYFRGEAHSHISMLAVAATATGRGVSSRLMAKAEAWSREQGHTMITLNVFHDNEHAKAVYAHFGYRPETLRYVKNLPPAEPG